MARWFLADKSESLAPVEQQNGSSCMGACQPSAKRRKSGQDFHQQGSYSKESASFIRCALFSLWPFPCSPVFQWDYHPMTGLDLQGFEHWQRSSLGGLSHSLCKPSKVHGESSRGLRINIVHFPGHAVSHCWLHTQLDQEQLSPVTEPLLGVRGQTWQQAYKNQEASALHQL